MNFLPFAAQPNGQQPNNFLSSLTQFYRPNELKINLYPKIQSKNKKSHKKKFTKDEDKKLLSLVQEFGDNNWNKISLKMENRSPRQCRERWKNYMNPKLSKKDWSKEEDYFLLKKYQEIGPHWNIISKNFENRSINSVRNRIIKLTKSFSNQKKNLNNTPNFNLFKNQFNSNNTSSNSAASQNMTKLPSFSNNNNNNNCNNNTLSNNSAKSDIKELNPNSLNNVYDSMSNVSDQKKCDESNIKQEKTEFYNLFWDYPDDVNYVPSW